MPMRMSNRDTMVRSRMVRSLWLCAGGALLAGFTNNYVAPGRPLAKTPLSESKPSETKTTPNLSHHDPLWSLSPPLNGFDQPSISVRTVAPTVSPPPKTIQTFTIRPGDGFLQPPGQSATRPRLPEAAGRGIYVQLSAQHSAQEAQTRFEAMQRRFAALQGRRPVTAPTRVGDSTFYRVLVGPFETTIQATEMCTELKVQGGQCIVQRLD